MTVTDQTDIIEYISKVAPNSYGDEELDEWAHALAPLDLIRDQWEPCVRAWRFTDPPKTGHNRLHDLFDRLRTIDRQGRGKREAAEVRDDDYIFALRIRLAPDQSAKWQDKLAATQNLSVREVVTKFWLMQSLKSMRVYGHVPRGIIDDAAKDVRDRCEPSSMGEGLEMLAVIVGEENAQAWHTNRMELRAKVKQHKGGRAWADLTRELAAAHDSRPHTDKAQRQDVCDELQSLSVSQIAERALDQIANQSGVSGGGGA
jgi:hypothetical protein